MILVQLSDFVGEYNIPDAQGFYTASIIQQYINDYEKPYMNKLLGLALADKVVAYLATSRSPVKADLDKIIDAFTFQDEDFSLQLLESNGMKKFLIGCIFFECISQNALVNSQSGVMNPQAETAIKKTPIDTYRFAERGFNKQLDTAEAIQRYCLFYPDKYADFAGVRIKVKCSNIL